MSDENTGAAPGPDTPPQAPETTAATPPTPTPWTPQTDERTRIPRGARRGGVTFGVLLIVIGVLVLFGRFVPWFDVWRLWPLIVIVSGVFEMVRPRGDAIIKRIAEGAGTIAVGLVLLGNTFGIIQWGVWLTMLSLWPLLLVALGIELLGRGLHMDWIRALSNVLLILGLAYGVFVLGPGWNGGIAWTRGFAGPAASYQDAAAHTATPTAGSAEVKVGATRLSIGAGDQLASISGDAPAGEAPTLKTSTSGGVTDVTVTDPTGNFVVTPDRTLSLKLDRSITWSTVRLDVGAIEGEADLRDLAVDAVDLNVGASSMRLWIGKKSNDVTVNVSGGATAVTVMVPADASVTVLTKSGLSAVSVPGSFRRVSGVPLLGDASWSAPGSGGPAIAITAQSGVSSFDIQTY